MQFLYIFISFGNFNILEHNTFQSNIQQRNIAYDIITDKNISSELGDQTADLHFLNNQNKKKHVHTLSHV